MAKRFTDTNKYKKKFIRGLQGAYKLLWDYLYHDCDHAGIWIVDFEIAQIYIGSDMIISKSEALEKFNSGEKRIIEVDGGSKWFIPSFIRFQYGQLNEKNRAHNSVISILKNYNLIDEQLNIKGLTSPLQGCKDMVKDKDKDMDKELIKGFLKKFEISFQNIEFKFRRILGPDFDFFVEQFELKIISEFDEKSFNEKKVFAGLEKWLNTVVYNLQKNNKNGKTVNQNGKPGGATVEELVDFLSTEFSKERGENVY